ncbi:MAG: aspartate carbamoyltransferase regulatory subunit [Prevotellaceae bacterium]|jgi:aspartate carbamoyltransferase regulatory subunit|nr:aspartate carbamoyltransferase regulatory subunit [Prevotellaceae bacterium]
MEKELKVSAIKNGTVIDRIPSKSLFKVISILGLEHCHNQITFGMNLESKHLGNKAIIKVTNRYFENDDINRIALVAPSAKLNTIRDYEVVEKRVVEVPDEIEGIVRCMNPKCITNHEKIPTKFKVISKNDDVMLLCHYCEKITEEKNFEISTAQ